MPFRLIFVPPRRPSTRPGYANFRNNGFVLTFCLLAQIHPFSVAIRAVANQHILPTDCAPPKGLKVKTLNNYAAARTIAPKTLIVAATMPDGQVDVQADGNAFGDS